MRTVNEIEQAVRQLPRKEFWAFAQRMDELREQQWDREIEEDSQPGASLDRLADEALREDDAGRARRP